MIKNDQLLFFGAALVLAILYAVFVAPLIGDLVDGFVEPPEKIELIEYTGQKLLDSLQLENDSLRAKYERLRAKDAEILTTESKSHEAQKKSNLIIDSIGDFRYLREQWAKRDIDDSRFRTHN